LRIYTIGHSTRDISDLCRILTVYHIGVLCDVRSFPRSFRNPQFNKELIAIELGKYAIRYVWLEKLGGRRKGLAVSSKNTCWRNLSFRNYADYMETAGFLEGIGKLLELADAEITAIMCAEAVYWRCHRSMIADFLKSKSVDVTHIFDEAHSKEHEYTQCAKVLHGNLTYHQ